MPDALADNQTPKQRSTVQRHLVPAPRDYFLGPVFAATKQTGPRQITIGNRNYLIGAPAPLDPTRPHAALDVRHGRAIFSLLSFRDLNDVTRIIRFSFNEFCCRFAHSQGGRYARDIQRILQDLLDTYLKITDLETGISHTYRLIEHVDIESRPIRRKDDRRARTAQQELWFNGATLSEAFYALLSRIVELQHLKLDVFVSIRSPLAQSIYLYIPSRAAHHSARQPFEITLTNLLNQVSHPIPQTKKLRKKLFTQNKNSILSQLDGKETLSGMFRVQLAETADATDWKLQAWVERQALPFPRPRPSTPREPRKDSKVVLAFLASGRPRAALDERLKNIQPLDPHELELLDKGKVILEGNHRFFEMAKALLGESRFQSLLAEAKGNALERIPPKKNSTARLIHRIMEAIKQP